MRTNSTNLYAGLIFAIGFAAACAIAMIPASSHGATPVSSAIAASRSLLQDELNDPGRARFRKVTVRVDSRGDPFVCGELNGANVMGGMTGWQPFLVDPSAPHVLFGHNAVTVAAVNSVCSAGNTEPTDGRDYSAQLKLN